MTDTLPGDIECIKIYSPLIKLDEKNKKYSNQLSDFYKPLLARLETQLSIPRKKGNQQFKTTEFQKTLVELLRKYVHNDSFLRDKKTKIEIKPEFSVVKRKYVDIIIGNPDQDDGRPVLYLEIKYNLDVDSLGAALMESILLKKRNEQDEFYVISFWEERRNKSNSREDTFNILCEQTLLKDYIKKIVCFNPKFDKSLNNVCQLLKTISDHYFS